MDVDVRRQRRPAEDGVAGLALHGPNGGVAALAAGDDRGERVDVLAARRCEAPALLLGRPEPPAARDHVHERRETEAAEQQLPGERQCRQPAASSIAVVALEELDRPAGRAGEREAERGVVGSAEEPVLERRGVGEQLDRAPADPPRGHEPFPTPHSRTAGLDLEPLRPHAPRAERTLRRARDELVHGVVRQARGYEPPTVADESPQCLEIRVLTAGGSRRNTVAPALGGEECGSCRTWSTGCPAFPSSSA